MHNIFKVHDPSGPVETVFAESASIANSNNGILDNKRNKIALSESEKPSVTVRLKRGAWEVEITTREDRVQQAVESVLAGMASKEPALVESQDVGAGERRGETSRSVITTMWKEGWFATPKSLSDVHEEMSRRGYHYDRTAVSHTLVDLVREGSLFRDGSMRNYRYVQKYPFKGPAGTS